MTDSTHVAAVLAALVLAATLLSGCGSVAPWMRGRHASSLMNPEMSALVEMHRRHAASVREGAALAVGAAGGACGCN